MVNIAVPPALSKKMAQFRSVLKCFSVAFTANFSTIPYMAITQWATKIILVFIYKLAAYSQCYLSHGEDHTTAAQKLVMSSQT